MEKFDQLVVLGDTVYTTPQGHAADELLDETEAFAGSALSAKVAAARKFNGKTSHNLRSQREARLLACGVLFAARTWGPKRIAVAGSVVVSLVNCLWSRIGAPIESMGEMTDPVLVTAAIRSAAVLFLARKGDEGSCCRLGEGIRPEIQAATKSGLPL